MEDDISCSLLSTCKCVFTSLKALLPVIGSPTSSLPQAFLHSQAPLLLTASKLFDASQSQAARMAVKAVVGNITQNLLATGQSPKPQQDPREPCEVESYLQQSEFEFVLGVWSAESTIFIAGLAKWKCLVLRRRSLALKNNLEGRFADSYC